MVLFTAHARDKIIARGIASDDVLEVLASGEVIKEYPDDKPYPSRLILGFISSPPQHLHVCGQRKFRRYNLNHHGILPRPRTLDA